MEELPPTSSPESLRTRPSSPTSAVPSYAPPPATAPSTRPPPRVETPSTGTVDPRPTRFAGAEVGPPGDTVLVRYFASPCEQLDRVEVTTSPAAVSITLFVGRKPGAGEVCILIAEERTVEVAVGEPVGARAIVDGAA